MRRYVTVFLLGTGGVLQAQQPHPEVRRAIPVNQADPAVSTDDYNNPAWMQKVQPSPTPVTATTPMPVATPIPMDSPRSKVGPEPGFTPYRPTGRVKVDPTPHEVPTARAVSPAELLEASPELPPVATPTPAAPAPPVALVPEPVATPTAPAPAPVQPPAAAQAVPTPDGDGVIRLSPSVGASQALERANGVYSRKMYDYAVMEYEKFLVSNPGARERDLALFRLGESHRLLGNDASARTAYEKLLMEYQTGEFAGAGAFRLGEYLYGDKLWDAALIQFQTASKQAGSAEVRLSATYQQARCLEKLKRTPEAITKYQEVAAVKEDNPYQDYARLSLAELSASSGQKKEALDAFSQIASSSSAPGALRAEASVKAAALAAELGDSKQAAIYFEQALALPDLGEWKVVAALGAMRTYYNLGDYAKVIELNDKYAADLTSDSQAEAWLLAANSYRQQGNTRAAKALYERMINTYPDAAQTQSARFQQLVSLYQMDDPGLIAAVDDFLKRSNQPKERAQAELLKAEALFKKQNYTEAGPIYARIQTTDLDDDIKGKALMKLGWCQSKTNQFGPAAESYSAYLQKFPNGASALSALAQRGLARQEMKNYSGAMADFEKIITEHPDAKERELALQQKALILGQQQDYKGMIAAFQQLLKEYPKTSAAGQANFWIGWASYENKDYQAAITSLEAARKLDPEQYGDRAGLRIVLCYYYLQDRPALTKALAASKNIQIPAEVSRWLGRKSFEEGDYATAERYLSAVVEGNKTADPDALIELAEAQIRIDKASAATPHVAEYLKTAREPYARARGLLAQARIALAAKQYDEAAKLNEDAMLLQPEGPLNADSRMVGAEILLAQGKYEDAAKGFVSIALLYNDPAITPRALDKAAQAYQQAGNSFEAAKVQRELQERFPDFKKSPKITQES